MSSISTELRKLEAQVEQLWDYETPKYSFSEIQKHTNITLPEDNMRVANTDGWSAVLV